MDKLFEKLFDINKIPTKLIIVVWVSSGLVIFAPEQLLSRLKLEGFLEDFGKFIGITFIISLVFVLIATWTYCLRLLKRRALSKKIRKKIAWGIQNLDFYERAVLREFFINDKNTLQLPLTNDTVAGLSNKGIIHLASNNGEARLDHVYFPCSISEFARKYLTYDAIDLPIRPNEEQTRQIMQNRPDWAKERERFERLFKPFF